MNDKEVGGRERQERERGRELGRKDGRRKGREEERKEERKYGRNRRNSKNPKLSSSLNIFILIFPRTKEGKRTS